MLSKPDYNPIKELKWFILIFFALGLIWFLAGGLKSERKEDPLITPQGETYGRETAEKTGFSWKAFFFPWASNLNFSTSTNNSFDFEISPVQTIGVGTSPVGVTPVQTSSSGSTGSNYYSIYNPATQRVNDTYNNIMYDALKSDIYGQIKIRSVSASSLGSKQNLNEEYVYLEVNEENTDRIKLTGMTLKSPITLSEVKIGQAVKVYYQGGPNYLEDIYLNPGDKVYVRTGQSPILMSFQNNRCLAYVIRDVPSSCPTPLNYPLPTGASRFSDACLDYMSRRISPCYDYTYNELPKSLEHECRLFIAEKTGYMRCVQDLGGKSGFLGNMWYVFLNRSQTLWKSSRDIIELRDQFDKLVDIVSR